MFVGGVVGVNEVGLVWVGDGRGLRVDRVFGFGEV